MSTFCERFGKRNPSTSAVRTRFQESDNGKRLVVMFLFSHEVVEIAGWTAGELLDLSCDGQSLVIEPSARGRTLHGKPPFVEFSFAKSQSKQVIDFFGFDARTNQFWDRYTIQEKRVVLLLKNINLPALP